VRRLSLLLLFVVLAATILFGTHYYVAQRLVIETGLPEPWRSRSLAGLVVLGASLVLQPFGERLLRPPASRIIAWPASLWMGFLFLSLLLLGVSDLLLWLAGPAAVAASDALALAVVALTLVAALAGLRGAFTPPRLGRVELVLERWPEALDGFRIAQISDLHIGPILGRRFARSLVERVNALEPDLVAVTGDLVDGSVGKLADEVAPLADLRGRHGVFFVTGNHDHYSNADAWARRVSDLGMRVLRNERMAIAADGGVFDLVGVDDHRGSVLGGGGEDLDTALRGRDPQRPAVLLAHDPSTFKRASGLGIDLQLSGHTHGGQIWPFVYLVRLAIPTVAGHYRSRGAQLFVSRGAGFWGPPMRLFAPAEINEIALRNPERALAQE
jgi:predicted MPP superfamily phosphohydrolase